MFSFDNSASVYGRSYTLIDGDPLAPCGSDIITIKGLLAVGEPVPEGFRVLTGNNTHSVVVATAYRDEITPGWEDE